MVEVINVPQIPSEPPVLKFMRLSNGEDLPIPTYTSLGAAGMDIHNADPDLKLFNGQSAMFSTGLAVAVPNGYELQVRSRSGLAAKHGIFVTNGPGTIDCDYRGEIKILLSHIGKMGYTIKQGDRIAQLVLAPAIRPSTIEIVPDFDAIPTERGSGGYGSTGR